MKTSQPPVSEPTGSHCNRDQQAGAGFSQVDLLTVIVVLVLLALLLTPALARTRVSDQAFQCRTSLRQLINGWRMFADDNSGNLCDPYYWVEGVLNYNSNNQANTNTSYLVNGFLGPYVRNPAVYKCPADQSQVLEGAVKMPRVRTFSMSQAFGAPGTGWSDNTYRHYNKSADMDLPSPANLWVMICENPDSVNDAAFAVVMNGNNPLEDKWQDGPTTLHNGGCSFAFADGHSEIHRWTDARTLTLNVTYRTPFPYGLGQPNNPDIQWVQDRTTAKR